MSRLKPQPQATGIVLFISEILNVIKSEHVLKVVDNDNRL